MRTNIHLGQIVVFPVIYVYSNNGPRKAQTKIYKGQIRSLNGDLAVIEGIDVPGLYNRPVDQLVVVGGLTDMIGKFSCPPDGPNVMIGVTGEKYANCQACSRCGGCAHGVGFVPMINFQVVRA